MKNHQKKNVAQGNLAVGPRGTYPITVEYLAGLGNWIPDLGYTRRASAQEVPEASGITRGPALDDTEITRADWDNVKRLKDVLSKFYFITKKMEGDIPLAGMILAEYRYIKALLNKKMTLTTKADFHPMHTKTLDRTNKYLSEALKCDAILLATILNPSYRLSIFNMFFPSHLTCARNLIQEKFIIQKIEYKASTPPQVNTQAGKQSTHDPVREFDDIEFFPDAVETSPEDELTVYLGGKYKWPHPQASKCLLWWKEHCQEFTVLSLLACCSTSA
ncbi:hypothetical protein PGT21_023075 [Puccinia graminis f. sp. tritici]|uniref:hAT-like transposase RNase-H fold domain-containing protein n=1 Tax=Puccinia graminis f. sp. tritici TaxID=56615 RepID=A0A5B0N3I9_PUCGR|nr:hypothetical protein PGT21_023075 [Puccinia graminis f. sp. tritici]